MKIINSSILSNLTVGNDSVGEFECRTSASNPQATLTIVRQSSDGTKYSDIQYKTASTYVDGINSVKFMVEKFIFAKSKPFSTVFFSCLQSIFFYMEIC